jgi:carboxyl-terminal processing protease
VAVGSAAVLHAMKRRFLYGILTVALSLYVVAGARVFRLSAADETDDAYQQLELFSRVLERVRRDYVDGEKLTYRDLVQGALKGMLSTLDPHSEFMDTSKYEDLKQDTEGTYGGVGLQVQSKDGALVVIAPMEDTPAFEAGLLPQDRIIKIDGKTTERMNQGDAVTTLRGESGSKVTLTVQRGSQAEPWDVVLTRAAIRVYSVKDINNRREFPVGDDKVGYVRLTQFAEHTAEELEEALKLLESRGVESLVMDLRGNPGGLLDQAVAVCEKFLDRNQPIVSTEGRNTASNTQRRSFGRGRIRKFPMVILVNGGSASAAEIVSGCLQDLKRAVLVGEQTFGKGSVQSILPLQDGSALRLTTAKYYTPSHRVIHENGLVPDIIVPLSEDEEAAIQLRRIPGGSATLEEALKPFESARRDVLRELVTQNRDPQLERAVDLLKGVNLFSKRVTAPKPGSNANPSKPTQ